MPAPHFSSDNVAPAGREKERERVREKEKEKERKREREREERCFIDIGGKIKKQDYRI